MEVFRTYYGPLSKAFGAIDADRPAAFHQEVKALIDSRNRLVTAGLVLPSEYLEVAFERQ